MKTQIMSPNFLTVFGFTLLVSFVLPIVSAFGTSEFEVGTQFGISHLRPDVDDDYSVNITYTQIPSTLAHIGASPTSLYATWFPHKQFAIGPEFSFGRMSVSEEYQGAEEYWEEEETEESITTFHLGGKASYFLLSHSVSSPYVLGRVSHTVFSGEDSFFFDGNLKITGIGIGAGYQWRIGSAFVLRAKGQYQRLWMSIEDEDEGENANEFSFTIGIGTRFGNSKSSTSEVPNTQ